MLLNPLCQLDSIEFSFPIQPWIPNGNSEKGGSPA